MLLKIFILVILIAINAIFAASEIAFLSFHKIKLEAKIKANNKKAIKIKKMLDNPSSFLATIQIGITLAGLLASAFAAEAFADILVQYFLFTGITPGVLKTIILIVVTIILSYFTLVFGELVPKRLAMRYPEDITYFVADGIALLMKLTYPFVWILTKSTNSLARLLGVEKEDENKLDLEEIKLIISDGKKSGIIEEKEAEYIFNIFKFNETKVDKIMIPKENIKSISIDIEMKDLLEFIRQNKYTRLPIYEENKDNIIGILNVKDIIQLHLKSVKFSLRELMRKPYKVQSEENIDEVFKRMQFSKQNMAIVYDFYNNVVGLVTIEDMIEEIVGNIFNEYDR